MAGISRIGREIMRAGREARQSRPGTGRGNRGDTPEIAERDRRAAAERAKTRANQEQARATERRGAISRSPISAEDIRQANTAAQFRDMQRRIDELPEGLRRTTMQRMLDRQQADFDAMRAAEADRASRRSAQAARDRTRNRPEDVTLPSMPFAKGGMAKKNYNKGGYANCGASMKPDGKRRK